MIFVIGLNSGKSIQIALVRKPDETILHVNERNNSVIANISLLTEYSNKPWNNSDRGIFFCFLFNFVLTKRFNKNY